MTLYNVVIGERARADWQGYIIHILQKFGRQPATNTHNDFIATIQELSRTAGSLQLYYDEPLAAAMGYHRINFVVGHHYYMLYRIVGHEAIIDFVSHYRRSVKRMIIKGK